MTDMTIEFRHSVVSDSYEKQANKQGFTYGENAEFVQKIGFGLMTAYINGCITDSEYDKILQRFQTKILANPEFLKKIVNE